MCFAHFAGVESAVVLVLRAGGSRSLRDAGGGRGGRDEDMRSAAWRQACLHHEVGRQQHEAPREAPRDQRRGIQGHVLPDWRRGLCSRLRSWTACRGQCAWQPHYAPSQPEEGDALQDVLRDSAQPRHDRERDGLPRRLVRHSVLLDLRESQPARRARPDSVRHRTLRLVRLAAAELPGRIRHVDARTHVRRRRQGAESGEVPRPSQEGCRGGAQG